ncbi:hypothetical protein GP486_002249 [Trichoglossum hirsutum]|uniref:Uncharacterized protein n=1 Tax=Trichoglossum hirsutum TaxID=265104 RepID=A0A9P8RRW8_9PEZI|nr:hypothetical protein GP486_002249 [Trichoglossum hirsutum]
MTSSTGSSESAKRPWPFDSDESPKRRPAFTSSFGPPLGNLAGHQLRQDTADCIRWKQELGNPTVGGWYSASVETLNGWNRETATFGQSDVFSSQIARTPHSNIWNNQTAIQGSHSTRNTVQRIDNAGYDIETHNQENVFTDQSAKTLCQGTWSTQTAAQGLYSLECPSLTSNHTAARLRETGAGELAPDNDTLAAQNFDTCDPNVTPWNTVGAEKESSHLELFENTLETPHTRVDHTDSKAALGRPQTITQTPVQIVEPTELTPNGNGHDVCFGTICDVIVRFLDDPHVLEKSNIFSVTSDKQHARRLAIVRHNHYYKIQCEQGVDIGVIDIKTAKALQRLDDIGSVTYEAVVDADDFDKHIKAWKNRGKAADWNLEINICGPQASRDKVGKLLSAARLYLQQPRYLTGDISVDNPHMITFPDLTIGSKSAQLPTSLVSPECSSAMSTRDLSEVLEGLDQNEYLEPVDIDSRVATTLLNHQREGVCFLLQREAAVPLSPFSLWEGLRAGEVGTIYQHKITRKRASKPLEETCGGILADEMGLGKTLIVLSTILATLNQSYTFSKSCAVTGSSRMQLSRATLVIAPSVCQCVSTSNISDCEVPFNIISEVSDMTVVLLDGWMAEVRRHVESGALRVQKYHGSSKETDITKLLDYDVILTTYATITAEFSRNSCLHGITWFRVVLDEAHTVRNQSTRCFRAVASLSAKIRWCLTGTPIQNKLEDLGALVRFLRIPFLGAPSAFRSHFVRPIEAGSSQGFENLRVLLRCICIRRRKDLLQLPEPCTLEHKLHLSPAERSHYLQIGESYRRAIDDAVCGKKPSEAYRTILQALLKLRMLCNHGTLQQNDATSAIDEADETLALLQEGTVPCVYCGEDIISDGRKEGSTVGRLLACSHVVCGGCVQQYQEDLERLSEGFEVACPLCKVPLNEDIVESKKRVVINDSQIYFSGDGVSTKLSRLLEDVKEHRFSEKCIIFSFWKKTLRIISALLSQHSLPFVQLDGSLSHSARREVLSAFQQDTQTSILLMTVGTGAVGLNLAVATRIHIVEPQWNPSIESQAIGRAVRLGQDKQVTIVRYVVQNTVEQYIQSRQSRKLQLAELGFDATDDPQDIKLKKLMELRELLDT